MSQPEVEATVDSRRSFLGRSALAAAAAAPLILGGSKTASAQTGIRRGRLPELYSGANRRSFQEIQNDENVHATTIRQLLGSAARPRATFQNLLARDVFQFAGLSFAFENTGVGAYLGATPAIFDKGVLASAASIALVEAYHSGFLNSLINQPLVPGGAPFTYPYTIAQVLQNAGSYVASLNGGPPLTFSMTPSAQNDIAILNFALLLEELEQEFYNINVPRFFA